MFERVYSQYGIGELEMSGTPHLQGPQPLSEIPNNVLEMFNGDSSIERVAICRVKDGRKVWVVFSPMQSNNASSGRAWACPHCGYQLNYETSLACERCEIARR